MSIYIVTLISHPVFECIFKFIIFQVLDILIFIIRFIVHYSIKMPSNMSNLKQKFLNIFFFGYINLK